MVKRILLTLMSISSIVTVGCSDAGMIDTPRDIDTLDQDRVLERIIDGIPSSVLNVSVNDVASRCLLSPTSVIDIYEYTDGTRILQADIVINNAGSAPQIPVDVESMNISIPLTELEDIAPEIVLPYLTSQLGLSASLFRNTTEQVDYFDSTRVPITVQRRLTTERVTRDDIYINRTYSLDNISDDTTRVPFSVFPPGSNELTIDTSYVLKITHFGDRRRTDRQPVAASNYDGNSRVLVQWDVDANTSILTLTFVVPGDLNSGVNSWLGTNNDVVAEVVIDLN